MLHKLYSILTRLLLPAVLGYFLWRSRRESAYRRHWGERLGFIKPRAQPTLWLHAASVGEVILVQGLLKALTQQYPDHGVLLTVMTPTGRAEAQRRVGDHATICYMPLDTPGATRRFIRRSGAVIGIVVETEVWPNLWNVAKQHGLKLVLINASLSARSSQAYQRWPAAALLRPALKCLDRVLTVGRLHAQRLQAAGVDPARLGTVGNMKYDRPDLPGLQSRAQELSRHWLLRQRPVWLAASTHEDEEAQLLTCFARLRIRQPDLLWIVAPRHPQRFEAVYQLLAQSGWHCQRRSRMQTVPANVDIVLLDTLGELAAFYGLADVAFVGGSLGPGIGGHNILEPAQMACVFATGPWTEDENGDLVTLQATGGARRIVDLAELTAVTQSWLAEPEARQRAARALQAELQSHQGALQKTLQELNQLIPAE